MKNRVHARQRSISVLGCLSFVLALSRVVSAEPTVFDAQVDASVVHRDFEYSDAVATRFPADGYPKLAPYRLSAGPAVGVAGHFYPGALFSSGAAANFGLELSYDHSLATKLKFAANTAYERELAVQAWNLFAGLRSRLPLGGSELALVAGYGESIYDLAGDESAPVVPDIHYQFVRVDASGRLALGRVYLGAHIGTRFVTGTGPLADEWFPNARATSIEAGVFGGYPVTSAFDVVVAGDFLRYGLDFNPVPASTDPWTKPVAGGASDTYLSATLALRVHLDGSAN